MSNNSIIIYHHKQEIRKKEILITNEIGILMNYMVKINLVGSHEDLLELRKLRDKFVNLLNQYQTNF